MTNRIPTMIPLTSAADLQDGDSLGKPKGTIFWRIEDRDESSMVLRNGLGNRGSGRTKTLAIADAIEQKWLILRWIDQP